MLLASFARWAGPAAVLFVASVADGQVLSVQDVPNPRERSGDWVTDQAGVLGARQQELNDVLQRIHDQTGAEVAVVVLRSIGEGQPRDFATRLFNHWGVGDRERDNGVLVLHVLDQRRVEVEVGYGLEGALPDAKASWIVHDVGIPFFKAGHMGLGHVEMARAVEVAIHNPGAGRDELVEHRVAVPAPVSQPVVSGSAPRTSRTSRTEPASVLRWMAIVAGLLLALGGAFWFRSRLRSSEDPRATYDLYDAPPLWFVSVGVGLCSLGALQAMAAWGVNPIHSALGVGSLLVVVGVVRIRAAYRLHRRYADSAVQYLSVALALPVLLLLFGFVFTLQGVPELMLVCQGGVLLTMSIFAVGVFKVSRQTHLRHEAVRGCPGCGSAMHLVAEENEGPHLEEGQRDEQLARSVDHAVWVCDCGQTRKERYETRSKILDCGKCGYKTDQLEDTVTLRAATTLSSGMAELRFRCLHCDNTRVEHKVIPRKSSSSSSGSGGFGGGGGGGSFGGGSSGGGGAGGSY